MYVIYMYMYTCHSVYNHIRPASQITAGCDYMLFKVLTYVRTCMKCTRMHIHTRIRIHMHTHAHTYKYAYTHIRTSTCTVYVRTCRWHLHCTCTHVSLPIGLPLVKFGPWWSAHGMHVIWASTRHTCDEHMAHGCCGLGLVIQGHVHVYESVVIGVCYKIIVVALLLSSANEAWDCSYCLAGSMDSFLVRPFFSSPHTWGRQATHEHERQMWETDYCWSAACLEVCMTLCISAVSWTWGMNAMIIVYRLLHVNTLYT